ncbi:MAG TPA: hypothetical protein VJ843_05955 [Candidatus Saccharimonadales bacterium]|nr:hypothetical protein [Candidatus Saccharimonadales bacterium]
MVKTFRLPLAILLISVIVLMIAAGMYVKRNNAYKAPRANTSTTNITVTNPEVLLNWMPQNIYKFTIGRLQDYSNNKSANFTSFSFDSVQIDEAKYKFNVIMNPGNSLHTVTVEPTNYSGTITASVAVDGDIQGVTSSDNSEGSGYIGFDKLTDQGLTSFQYKGLQQAFSTFDDNLKYVSVDSDTLVNTPSTDDSIDAKSYFTFDAIVDGKTYSAKAYYWDITSVRLYLYDSKNQKQVFDSGNIDISG